MLFHQDPNSPTHQSIAFSTSYKKVKYNKCLYIDNYTMTPYAIPCFRETKQCINRKEQNRIYALLTCTSCTSLHNTHKQHINTIVQETMTFYLKWMSKYGNCGKLILKKILIHNVEISNMACKMPANFEVSNSYKTLNV